MVANDLSRYHHSEENHIWNNTIANRQTNSQLSLSTEQIRRQTWLPATETYLLRSINVQTLRYTISNGNLWVQSLTAWVLRAMLPLPWIVPRFGQAYTQPCVQLREEWGVFIGANTSRMLPWDHHRDPWFHHLRYQSQPPDANTQKCGEAIRPQYFWALGGNAKPWWESQVYGFHQILEWTSLNVIVSLVHRSSYRDRHLLWILTTLRSRKLPKSPQYRTLQWTWSSRLLWIPVWSTGSERSTEKKILLQAMSFPLWLSTPN